MNSCSQDSCVNELCSGLLPWQNIVERILSLTVVDYILLPSRAFQLPDPTLDCIAPLVTDSP